MSLKKKVITVKPGQAAPVSGQYEIIDETGKRTHEERTVVKGHPMPPTPQKHEEYRLVDETKHKKK